MSPCLGRSLSPDHQQLSSGNPAGLEWRWMNLLRPSSSVQKTHQMSSGAHLKYNNYNSIFELKSEEPTCCSG